MINSIFCSRLQPNTMSSWPQRPSLIFLSHSRAMKACSTSWVLLWILAKIRKFISNTSRYSKFVIGWEKQWWQCFVCGTLVLFLFQHHQQDHIVCEVSIFLSVELWVILYCCCETGCMAVHVSDGFDIGHCHERKKTRTFGDWVCLGLGFSVLVERREGKSTQKSCSQSLVIHIYIHIGVVDSNLCSRNSINHSVTSFKMDSCLVVYKLLI